MNLLYSNFKCLSPPSLKNIVFPSQKMSSPAYIVQYSAKCYAVFGDTKPIKEQLKTNGCRFNSSLVDPSTGNKSPGWILGNKNYIAVCEVIKTSNSPKTEPVKPTTEVVTKKKEILIAEPVNKPSAEVVTKKKESLMSKVTKFLTKPKKQIEEPSQEDFKLSSPQKAVSAALSAGLTREMAQKYHAYYEKKYRIQETGRSSEKRDASRSKCYDAEFSFCRQNKKLSEFISEAEIIELFNEIVSSSLYKELSRNNKPTLKIVDHLTSSLLGNKTVAGCATATCVTINRTCGLSRHVVIHELTHTCGNPHHDIKFRADEIKLVSEFIGKKEGTGLKKSFTSHKLKTKLPDKFMSPTQWLESYKKMENIRNKKITKKQ